MVSELQQTLSQQEFSKLERVIVYTTPTQAVMKTVLVTASSAGLGAQIARAFAPDHRVIINYTNNRPRAETLLQELSQVPCAHPSPANPRFHLIQADAGHHPDIRRLVDETVRLTGRLDIVASNVGWTRMTNWMDLDQNVVEPDWDRCFQYNVKAHLWLMHAAKPHLEASEGAFVLTASAAGVKPGGSSLAYSVTKAAQVHLGKALAISCAPRVRVNAVSPGLLLTDWGMSFPEAKREGFKNMSKLKRIPTLEDVADQVRLFALSNSTTGQNLLVDAGFTL